MARRGVVLAVAVAVLAACSSRSAPPTVDAVVPPTTTESGAEVTTSVPASARSTAADAGPATTTSSVPPPTSVVATVPTPVPDGTRWARVAFDRALLGSAVPPGAAVAPASGLMVSVGSDASGADWDAAVWVSDDGITWERAPHHDALGGPGDQAMVGVVTLGDRLIAVGYERQLVRVVVDAVGTRMDTPVSDAAVWTSRDGLTWSRVSAGNQVFGSPDEQDDQAFTAVTTGGPGLVAVGYERDRWYHPEARFNARIGVIMSAAVWTSPDGETWERVADPDGVFGSDLCTCQMRAVTAWSGGLVAVGSSVRRDTPTSADRRLEAAVWTSADGISWSRVPPDESVFGGSIYEPGVGHDLSMRSVTAGGPGLVAVGSDVEFWWDAGVVRSDGDVAIWVSGDGRAWQRVTHDEVVFGGPALQEINSIIATPTRLIALGSDHGTSPPVAVMWVSPPPS